MLKISDILKKAKRHIKPEKHAPEDTVLSQSGPPLKAESKNGHAGEYAADIHHSSKLEPGESTQHMFRSQDERGPEAIDSDEIIQVYQKAISLAEQIINPFCSEGTKLVGEIEGIIRKFIEFLEQADNQLLKLFYGSYATEKGYMYQHSVNVCILCLRLGLALSYNHNHLQQLGLAAFLHDIGLIKFDTIISLPRRLTDAEYNTVKKHPVIGKDMLKNIAQDLNFDIFDAIAQEHERINATGYPFGLEKKDICMYARLIGLADVYEAMMHARPYRDKLNPPDAIKEIIKDKEAFEYTFLKVLIDTVGIFPIATLVRLNTKEVGIVLQQTPHMPLRPVVNITHNAQEQKLPEPKRVNLAVNFSVYIQDCFIEHSLKNEKDNV